MRIRTSDSEPDDRTIETLEAVFQAYEARIMEGCGILTKSATPSPRLSEKGSEKRGLLGRFFFDENNLKKFFRREGF